MLEFRTQSGRRYVEELSNSIIMNTYGFGDTHMKEYLNLSTELGYDGRGVGNFDHVDYMLVQPTGKTLWGAISKFQILSKSDYDYVASIQPKDYDLQAKMNWFWSDATSSTPDRPYWYERDVNNNISTYSFGTMVFGHSKIRVEAENGQPKLYKFYTVFPNEEKKGYHYFCKVDGFKRSMLNMPVQWLLENAYIQIATQANAKPQHNTIAIYDRGIKYHPVWDFSDWHGNLKGEYYIWRDALYL